MQRTITYYFTLISPWSYLGHARFMDLVARHDLAVTWKPMNLGVIFPESGGLPLARRHPLRRAYRDIELQRWRAELGLPLNLRPAYWPIDIGPADRIVIELAQSGANPDSFVRAAFAGLWVAEENLADPAVLAGCLSKGGYDPSLAEAAQSGQTADVYAANSEEALAAGVFGAPTYILDGEPFWGQDRIPLLDQALTSGRDPFRGLDAIPPRP